MVPGGGYRCSIHIGCSGPNFGHLKSKVSDNFHFRGGGGGGYSGPNFGNLKSEVADNFHFWGEGGYSGPNFGHLKS